MGILHTLRWQSSGLLALCTAVHFSFVKKRKVGGDRSRFGQILDVGHCVHR